MSRFISSAIAVSTTIVIFIIAIIVTITTITSLLLTKSPKKIPAQAFRPLGFRTRLGGARGAADRSPPFPTRPRALGNPEEGRAWRSYVVCDSVVRISGEREERREREREYIYSSMVYGIQYMVWIWRSGVRLIGSRTIAIRPSLKIQVDCKYIELFSTWIS